jgi:hypothetical protein
MVRIPMRFQRRGGRRRIVTPDGSAMVPATRPQPDGTLIKALARAWQWQRMSRILRLALLAPDIVEAILAGRADHVLVLERLKRRFSWSWEEQHELLLGRVFS